MLPKNVISRSVGYADLARHARTAAKSTDDTIRDNARRHLVERMGKLRGLPQKVGQMLSMSDDAEKAEAFANLTDNAEPIPFDQIQPILEAAWNNPLDTIVKAIDEHGLAASLGQVHHAVLHDGREVAIKVRYPGIEQAVKIDLKALGWLSAPMGDLRRKSTASETTSHRSKLGFDMADYRSEILRDLTEELDYELEADRTEMFAKITASVAGWRSPGILREFCTENVLVTEWLDGQHLDDVKNWSESDRQPLAWSFIRGFFKTLFESGWIHADPHPGNYRFSRTDDGPGIALFDFGSTVQIPQEHRIALLKLIDITTTGRGDPYQPLAALGFNQTLLRPIRRKLPALCRVMLEPFTRQYKYDMSTWNRAERIDDILGEDRWNFRMSGPASLILLMRAFKGLTWYLEQFDRPVSWGIAIKPYLDAHRKELDHFDPPVQSEPESSFETLADHLRIQVLEQDSTKVSLTFPATAVDNLDELMDDDLRRRIDTAGIDINKIVRNVRGNGYRPQPLFTLTDEATRKTVHVWLE